MSNILFITTFIPYPPHGGAYQRSYNIIRHLAKKHNIYLIGFIKKADDYENAKRLEEICKIKVFPFRLTEDWSKIGLIKGLFSNLISPLPYVTQKSFKSNICNTIKRLTQEVRIDIFHCDMIELAEYINIIPKVPLTILVNHNVESTLMLRHAEVEKNPIKKWFFLHQYKKLLRYEKKMCPLFNYCVAVSELDKQQLQSIAPQAAFTVIPNGVDVDYFRPQNSELRTPNSELIFAGRTDYLPNIDGLNFFLHEIFPLIKKEIKDARLTIIGKTRTNNDIGLPLTNDVTHLGFVEDIRPYIGKAAVYVVPLRIGGGTRLKILDAMAMGKAIVSTSIGAEGIDVTHGKNILIADTPEDFSRQVIRVLNDDTLRQSLGKEGRRLVEEKYSWDIIGKKMDEIYT